MDDERRTESLGRRQLCVLGIFFGMGFFLGFLFGFGYARGQTGVEVVEVAGEPLSAAASAPLAVSSLDIAVRPEPKATENADTQDAPLQDIELVLEEHLLDEDEDGLFISGTIVNASAHAFDAARVTFELCDAQGEAYTTVTDVARERMEPGDAWGFVIHIPYTDMELFSSYRLQSIMGVTN